MRVSGLGPVDLRGLREAMSDQSFLAVKLVFVESVFGHGYVTVVQALVNVEEHTAYRFVVKSVDGYGVCEPKVCVEVSDFYVVEALIEELGEFTLCCAQKWGTLLLGRWGGLGCGLLRDRAGGGHVARRLGSIPLHGCGSIVLLRGDALDVSALLFHLPE